MVIPEHFNTFKDNLQNLEFIAKGHRSYVYKALYRNMIVAVKVERKDIDAINHIQNEINWLKILNKLNIGPKLIYYGVDFFVCEYLDGGLFIDNIKRLPLPKIKSLLKELFFQCRTLDELKVTKEEMHHPVKHIFIVKGKPVMIDFERCHKTLKPKNVTQFCQFILSKKFQDIISKKLDINRLEVMKIMQVYKHTYSKASFNNLLKTLQL